MSQLLKIDQVAEKLNVSRRTIERWVRDRKIPVVSMPGRNLRFDEKKIESWINTRTINSKQLGAA